MPGQYVFVDAGIPSLDKLLKLIGGQYTVVLLDGNSPALQQIANALSGTHDVSAIHVITHGGPGFLETSSGTLDATTLASAANAAALAEIRSSLAQGADILLYGCDVGYGEQGSIFLQTLAQATGADIAASTDDSGSALLGGNSILEATIGSIGTAPLDLSTYSDLLTGGMFYSSSGNRVGNGFYSYGQTITFNAISVNITDPHVQLIVHANDVDYDASDPTSERDAVYISGPGLSDTFVGYLVGTNGNWSYTTFDVSSLVTTTGNYTVSIRPDVNNDGWVVKSDFAELFFGDGGYYITTLQESGSSVSSVWNSGANGGYTIEYTLIRADGTAVAQASSSVTEGDTSSSAVDTNTLHPNSSAGYYSWSDIPDGTYTLQAKLYDSSGVVHDSVSITVNISNDTTPPNITGPSGSAGDASSSTSINENTTAVATFSANETVTWSIYGGADSGKFQINSSTGALSFRSAPTFEIPTDSGADNNYEVIVKAVDAAGNPSYQTVTVSVLNVIEHGSIDITTATDSGANDTLTNNSHPVITFSGEPNLTVTLKGPDNTLLAAGQYTVAFTAGATNESGTYTVTLIDAKSGSGGASDPFGTYSSGSATSNPASSADGTYTILLADNYSHTATAGTFTIDTTPPQTSAFDMTDATDTGRSQADEITRNGKPVLTFTGEAGLTITLKGVDGAFLAGSQYSVSASSPPDANGNVTYTVTLLDANTGSAGSQPFGTFDTSSGNATGNPASTIDGTYTIVATDAAANSADVGTFVIDTTKAVVSNYDMINTRESGISLDDELTNNGKPILTFNSEAGLIVTVTGPDGTPLVQNSHYTVSYNASGGGYTVSLIDANTSTAAYDPFGTYYQGAATGNSASTRDGTYTISVADTAGNTTTVGTFEIDTTAPGVQVNAGSIHISNDTGSSSSDFITSAATQTVTATLSRALQAGERLLGTIDGGKTWLDVTSNVAGTGVSWNVQFTGSGEIRLKVQDAAGNDGIVRAQAYVLDTTTPSNSVRNIHISNDTGLSSTDFITSAASQSVTATLANTLTSGEKLYGSANGGTTWVDMTPYLTGKAINWTGVTLSGGTSSLQFYIVDLAGNETSKATQAYTLLSAAANVSLSNIHISSDTGVSATDFITSSARQTITATLTGTMTASQKLYGSVDGGTTWTDVTSQVSGSSISWANATLKTGAGQSIKFKVMDAAGNQAAITSQNYVLDTTKPTVTPTITAISADNGVSASDFVTSIAQQNISATLSSGLSGDKLMASIDGGSNWTDISSSVTGTGVLWQNVTLAAGKNTVLMRVEDNAGNVGALASKIVTIQNVASIAPLDAVKPEGNSGGPNPFTFTVSLASAAITPITLTWSVKGYGANGATLDDFGDGTAKAFPSGQINFAVGETSKVITVPVHVDTIFAQDQSFVVSIAKSSTDTTVSLGTSVAYGTILNDDALTGTGSADRLLGSNSAETISGLAGNDRIEGQGGDDTLLGGSGRDTFVFAASGNANGHDTLDFVAGPLGDIFDFSAFLPGGQLDRHGAAAATGITPYLTSDTGDANITGKIVLLDGGATSLTKDGIVAEIQGSGNAFALSPGGKAVIVSGNSAAAGALQVFYVDDTLDGHSGTVTADDVSWVGTTYATADFHALVTANFIPL